MINRRVLWLMIVGLSGLILISGSVVGVLAWQLWSAGTHQIVILGAEQELSLLNSSGRAQVMASDASNEPFRFPTVSPDGRMVAYISQDTEGFGLFRLDLGSGERTELYRSRENPPFYLAWSPDGTQISFLSHLRAGGLGINMVPSDGSRSSNLIGTTLGTSYFAWHPDGNTLLLHNGGNSDQAGRIATYHPGDIAAEALRTDPGLFQAPAWSLSGSEFFYVAQPPVAGGLSLDTIESVLTRVDAQNNPTVIVSEPQAAMFFGRAPESDRIAYTTITPSGFGPLKLVGANSTSAEIISRPDEQVAAFFWAPDGSQIAYLTTPAPVPGLNVEYTWHVVDTGSGSIRDFNSFQPNQFFTSMLSYFDAYAISLQLWSPDSAELIYSASDGIYILNTRDGNIRRAGDGELGMWVPK